MFSLYFFAPLNDSWVEVLEMSEMLNALPSNAGDNSAPAPRRNTLIVDDDERITEGLACFIASEDRTVITCNDIESAQIVLERMAISEVIADVQFSGRFNFEGLALITHIREFAPKARVILMSGQATAELREEATGLGAFALLEKPFDPDLLETLLSSEAN